ncbi:MAG: hypothetical protein OXC63_06000 [Aestuariivita sp.]|nr:hypothetical protein [Aestuariivita sp.]MCY4346308.1 hypothetical protein [Aestuariivita sp.]
MEYEEHGDMFDEYGNTDAIDNLYDIQGRISISCADYYESSFVPEVKDWINQLQKLIQQNEDST